MDIIIPDHEATATFDHGTSVILASWSLISWFGDPFSEVQGR